MENAQMEIQKLFSTGQPIVKPKPFNLFDLIPPNTPKPVQKKEPKKQSFAYFFQNNTKLTKRQLKIKKMVEQIRKKHSVQDNGNKEDNTKHSNHKQQNKSSGPNFIKLSTHATNQKSTEKKQLQNKKIQKKTKKNHQRQNHNQERRDQDKKQREYSKIKQTKRHQSHNNRQKSKIEDSTRHKKRQKQRTRQNKTQKIREESKKSPHKNQQQRQGQGQSKKITTNLIEKEKLNKNTPEIIEQKEKVKISEIKLDQTKTIEKQNNRLQQAIVQDQNNQQNINQSKLQKKCQNSQQKNLRQQQQQANGIQIQQQIVVLKSQQQLNPQKILNTPKNQQLPTQCSKNNEEFKTIEQKKIEIETHTEFSNKGQKHNNKQVNSAINKKAQCIKKQSSSKAKDKIVVTVSPKKQPNQDKNLKEKIIRLKKQIKLNERKLQEDRAYLKRLQRKQQQQKNKRFPKHYDDLEGFIVSEQSEQNFDWKRQLKKVTGKDFSQKKYRDRDRMQIMQSTANDIFKEQRFSTKFGIQQQERQLRLENSKKKHIKLKKNTLQTSSEQN